MSDEPDNLSPPDVNPPRILVVAASVLCLLGGALAVATGFYAWQAPKQTFTPPRAFPKPRVIETQKGEEQQWITGPRQTPESRMAQAMPIEQAMEMVVRRGADGYAPIEQKVLAQKSQAPSAEQGKGPPTSKTRRHVRRHEHGRRHAHPG